ncbi:exopolysaccharide biosynthesis protein [uncultured Jannaschia sp.]|uniref:exopolysaccharide biosynthesis protein n=1 Tax=uncultured Jannaschia sp. TaxID=293347 RepID=UPI002639C3CB|nr:exopolysaccharide biosynthesis protein [uncultured Jannaschia sp.]
MSQAEDIVDDLDEAAEGQERVRAGDIADTIGHRGIGALLMLPAALELTPVGGIPGVPTVLALIVATFAVQILLGRDDMWLPDWIERRRIDKSKLDAAVDKMRPAAEWADRHLGRHATWLVDAPAPRVVAVAILALCATVPPLEVVPFASSIPMGTIVLFGLALTMRDGRVMALAWVAFAAALWGVWTLWP